MVRNAETMPLVTVILSPRSKGYPSATTSSPSRTEVANGSTVSVRDGVTLSSAMSRGRVGCNDSRGSSCAVVEYYG